MKNFPIVFLTLILLSAGCAKQNISVQSPAVVPQPDYSRNLEVGNKNLLVEIANNDQKRATGLSYRTSLPNNDGMLFEFASGTTPAFWMKQMNFNLDLIWIYQNKIVGITADVPASKAADIELPLYYPPSVIDQVLEVNAGWSKQNNITVGDKVSLQ